MNLLSLIKAHRGKIFLGVVSFFIFSVLIFPYSETSDWISNLVADSTQNQVQVRFDKLGLSLSPGLGLRFRQANVRVNGLGKFEMDTLNVAPSVSSIFSSIPYGAVSATGLLGKASLLEISLKSGSRSESGTDRQKLEIHAEKMGLAELKELADLPLLLKGEAGLSIKSQFDLAMSEPPEGDFQLDVDQFDVPSQIVNTPGGPLSVPELKFSGATFRGKLNAGRLVIEEGHLGTDKDEVFGNLTGSVGIAIQKQNTIVAKPTNYTFDLDLKMKPRMEEKLSLFLIPLDSFKTTDKGLTRYQLRLEGQNFLGPPNMTALH